MNHTQKVFKYHENIIRTVTIGDEVWFIAKDVCDALQIKNARDALNRLDNDEKGVVLTDTLGGKQKVTSVNEPGLYSLILGSRKEEARAFKRWLTHEVLPTIRKNGIYLTPEKLEEVLLNPDTLIRLASDLKAEREKRIEAEKTIEQNQPKVVFADAVSTSKTSILIGDLAKLLKQNGYDTGQKRLFSELRDKGYLIKRKGSDYNSPTQRSMELGLFEVKETAITHSDGHVRISKTTKVTGKGQLYFINKLIKKVG